MSQFIVKRILMMIPVFIGISIIVFILIYSTPGDPFMSMLDLNNVTPEQKEVMLESIGYYDPIPVKYVKWVSNVMQGDLGYSIWYKEPVKDVLMRRIGNTFMLSILALILSVIISVPLGVISATRQYSIFDYIVTVIALVGLSIPSFFFALGLIKLLGIDMGLFPISGIETVQANYTGLRRSLDILSHMAMPLIVLTFAQTASFMRYTRSAMLEIIRQDYIRTARAKGLSESIVIYKHALRNAMIPLVTMITLSMGYLLSGAALVENVFVWPGMGSLIYQSVTYRDYTVITAGTLLMSVSVLMANLLADVLYAFIDPRIKFD